MRTLQIAVFGGHQLHSMAVQNKSWLFTERYEKLCGLCMQQIHLCAALGAASEEQHRDRPDEIPQHLTQRKLVA